MKIVDLCTPLFQNDLTCKQLSNALSTYYCNTALVEDLYFIPKKISRRFLDERLVDSAYLSRVAETIHVYRHLPMEHLILEHLHSFEEETGYSLGNETLYLIFGLDTTTIYSTNYNGENVTVLLLESTGGNMDKLRLLLAHEFTHLVRKASLNQCACNRGIGERLVSEGIAIAYSRTCVPGGTDADYCLVPTATVDWVKAHWALLNDITSGQLESPDAMDSLFSLNGKPALPDMPHRTGYVYGYLNVQNYLRIHAQSVKDIMLAKWTDILND